MTSWGIYVDSVSHLPNVKAVALRQTNDTRHFITILDKRNIETREKIYEVEMSIFDRYLNEQFDFSVYCEE